MRLSWPLLGSLLVLTSLAAAAAPVPVPEPLAPWVPWALHGHEAARCPFLLGQAAESEETQGTCAWATELSLQLEEAGGRFTQSWRLFAPGRVSLPGDAKRWPQGVTVDGRPAVVLERGGTPTVELGEGVHTVAGSFRWDALPESLAVPPRTGLLKLTVRGRPVAQPNRSEPGTLFLEQAPREEETARDAVELLVYRRVADGVPLTVDTRVDLKVSGKAREVLLGKALLPDAIPLSLVSALPARLEPDGRLRVQVRPGQWQLTLTSRHEGPLTALTRPAAEGPWTEGDEVWVFEANSAVRAVTVEGVPGVDPAQTTLPAEWRHLPAYAVAEGATLTLEVQRRGNEEPAPDRLTLSRNLWLDFDGRGLTASDTLSGSLSRSWRLTMQSPATLGRVSVGGQDQFITRLAEGTPAGVEVRQGQVQVSADSRLPLQGGRVPAVGWAHDVQQLSATLHLPPGWRLLHASGPDSVSTWFTRWTLLDLFLVVIIALATARLFGPVWGGVALLTLGLLFHEKDAPRLAWLAVLALEALVRALPVGRLQHLLRLARWGTVGVLILSCIGFAVDHVRQGLYPVLQRPWAEVGEGGSGYPRGDGTLFGEAAEADAAEKEVSFFPPAPPAAAAPAEGGGVVSTLSGSSEARMMKKGRGGGLASLLKSESYKAQAFDKDAMVQTGPGLPQWGWERVALHFSGPVQQDQQLSLWLVPPWANRLLAFVRVGLMALFALLLLGVPRERWPRLLKPRVPAAGVAALLLALLLPGVSRAELPNEQVLAELRRRLLEKPACAPHCADSPRMVLEATARTLRLRLEVAAEADTGVPLPGGAEQWEPERVLLDNEPARALLRDEEGVLHLWVPRGLHQVVLEGALPARDTVTLSLPLKPHRVEASATGWTVDGLFEDGQAEDDLQLSREASGAGAGSEEGTLQPVDLPPFLHVQRRLSLGLTWEVVTEVTRVSPPGSAVVVPVPLLPGEAVMTEGVRVEEGKVLLNLGPQATSFSWASKLEQKTPLLLTAARGVPWSEVWQLDVGPTWHFEAAGLPPIHPAEDVASRVPEYRPWPGETLTLALTRPSGVGGQTLTVDRSELVLEPGLRSSVATLTLSLRSSRGGQHTLTLPEGAELEGLTLDGQKQPLRQEGRKVTFPVRPGAQGVRLSWRHGQGISALFRTPQVDLGVPSVNAHVSIQVPRDRWVLLTFGPPVGPAVLFWGVLLVVLAVAAGLGRLSLTPLRVRHWALLGLGLSQLPVVLAATVAGWLLLLGWRRQAPQLARWAFNLRQLLLVGATLAALAVLAGAIHQGLLGAPDMQVEGNGSSTWALQWYQDRSEALLPGAGLFSVPLLVYRGAMLAWAMWLAFALLGWLKWGWACFSEGGTWRPAPARGTAGVLPQAEPPVEPTPPPA